MEYGLYLAHSTEPVFKGTARECNAQVDKLTDEQKMSGWTVGPIQPEPAPLPVDPGQIKRILVLAVAMAGLIIILGVTLWVRGCNP